MKFPVKNDWITTLKNDLTQCEITLSESEIKVMKKDKFKRLVNMKVKQLSDEYLIDLQQAHKKSRNIYVTENIKKYLISEEITLEQKRLLFQMRNFMCDVKTNYKCQYSNNMQCRLCDQGEESVDHLLMCDQLISSHSGNITHSDVWSSITRQESAIRVLQELFKIRNIKYEKRKLSDRTQANPVSASSSYTVQSMTLD